MIVFGLLPLGIAALWLVWCFDDIRAGARFAVDDLSGEPAPAEVSEPRTSRRPRCRERAGTRCHSAGHPGLTGSSIWMLHA